ncbi:YoaK family protein [Acetobacter sp. KSO5]|uniref:YoaK family protein n=1 Tax=Acetobacter sp. KSO5 TaxID=3373674 RepID=UPI00376ECED4
MASAPVLASARRILLLGLLAGYINALSFIDLGGMFAGAMTGNTIHMDATLAAGNWPHGLQVAELILVFFLTAILAACLRLIALPVYGFVIMAVLLVIAQSVHGAPNQVRYECLVLPALMAIQGQTLARFSGNAIQTVVITSNLLKCAAAFAAWLMSCLPGSAVPRPPRSAIFLPGLSWVAFLMGAATASIALSLKSSLPFLWPLPLVALLCWDISRAERANCLD